MTFDVDLHRITLTLANRLAGGMPLEMSVVDAGPRDAAQAMVFIHGFGGRAAYWHYQLEHFQSDYRVIALDLRGHGYSDAPTAADGARYDVPELVADIEAALATLQVPQRFILVAHSFGGALASYFIRQHPERIATLAIIASAVKFHLRWPGRLLLRVPPALLTWIGRVLPYLGYNAARLYPPAHAIYLQNRNALSVWDGSDYLRGIRTPTIVILGQRDMLFSVGAYQQVAQLIPDAEQVVIPVSAHQVMVERPDAVNRTIERFLQSQADPVVLAESRSIQKIERRAQRLALEAQRPWLTSYDARTPYQIKMPSLPLARLLEASARRFAKTPAIHYFGRQMDWMEVDRLASRFAQGLMAAGIRPGEKVMLALPNMPQWVIAYFGILKIRAVAVLCNPETAIDTLLSRIGETATAMLITTGTQYHLWCEPLRVDTRAQRLRQIAVTSLTDYMGWESKLSFLFRPPASRGNGLPGTGKTGTPRHPESRLMKFSQLLGRGRPALQGNPASMEDVAVIAYTFGTGSAGALPVPLSHRNLAANALQLRHWLPESRPGDERFLAQQPLWSAYGLTGLLHLGLYLGASLILLPDADIERLLKAAKKWRPTYFPTTPRMVRQLAHTPDVRRYGLASIRVCAVSGSSLSPEIREEFEKITRGRLIEAYGLTEAAPAVLAMPLAARRRSAGTGVPLPDTEAKIVDPDTGLPCAADIVGELWVRGPQVFAGYFDKTESHRSLSTQRLQQGWLATGDMASMDEDGFFMIFDRKDNMLIRDGQRVFPRQIEDVLQEHPAIAEAQVKRVGENDQDAQLQARVVLHRNMRTTVEELFKYCGKRLHPTALPDSIAIEQQKVV